MTTMEKRNHIHPGRRGSDVEQDALKECILFKPLLYKMLKGFLYLRKYRKISGQDGATGRYTFPPCTTRRKTTNLKPKNNQNCQKIELYGSLTNKELRTKHSTTLVEGTETSSQGR